MELLTWIPLLGLALALPLFVFIHRTSLVDRPPVMKFAATAGAGGAVGVERVADASAPQKSLAASQRTKPSSLRVHSSNSIKG